MGAGLEALGNLTFHCLRYIHSAAAAACKEPAAFAWAAASRTMSVY